MNIYSLIKHLFDVFYVLGIVEGSEVKHLYLPGRSLHAHTPEISVYKLVGSHCNLGLHRGDGNIK